MSEVKTAPVEAVHIESWREFADKRIPGSVSFSSVPDEKGELHMAWVCPCGCGHQTHLLVGDGFKPDTSPSWQWNGSREKPTLTPSIHRPGHWHGYLTDGVWRSA